jgi:chromosome partitioning protein
MKRKRLVLLSEWANQRGISYTTAYRMAKRGEIPTEQVGRFSFVVEEVEVPEGKGVALTFFTHAGGAGKTSLARDLGYELASRGYKVLLIDMDPQANLTDWLGFTEVEPEETALFLYEKGILPEPKGVMPNLYLIPAEVSLAKAEVVLSREPHTAFALRGALEELRGECDFIFVDSLPSLGTLAASAALSGDGLVVPVELSRKGVQALTVVLEAASGYANALRKMRVWQGPSFVRLFVPNHMESAGRAREAHEVLEEIAEKWRVPIAPPLARRPAAYREAQARNVPVQLTEYSEVREELKGVAEKLLEVVLPVEEVAK